MSPETAVTANPAFKAISNRDYRRQPLPSPFGAEIKYWTTLKSAREWLSELGFGGRIEQWDEGSKAYKLVEVVEATK